MNILEESSDHRAPVNYHQMIQTILKTVEKAPESLIKASSSGITFDVDSIAHHIATHYPQHQMFFEPRKDNLFISAHLADLTAKTTFSADILQLRSSLEARFRVALPQDANGELPEATAFVRKLFTSLQDFAQDKDSVKKERDPQVLRYEKLNEDFPLKRQRLHLRTKKTEQDPCLKGHKLTIQVDRLKDFASQITNGVITYLQNQPECTEDEIEQVQQELQRRSQKQNSDLSRLSEALVRHSLARIQRSAQIYYLHYLQKGLQDWHAPAKTYSLPWLRTITRRLELLEKYIADSTRSDAFYKVSYQQQSYNLRDLFTRSDAFDPLPIMSVIDGMLGEQSQIEREQKTFTFGFKLKLNGPVQVHSGDGRSVFEYYNALLDPGSKLAQQRERETQINPRERQRFLEKVLRVALLYCFIFTRLDDADFNPAPEADQLLAVFKGTDEQAKREYLAQLSQRLAGCKRRFLDPLRDMLATFLHNQKIGLPRADEALILSLHNTILAGDLDSLVNRYEFFQEDWARNEGKDILKYVSIDKNGASSESLCRFPVSLTLETIYYDFAPQPTEKFTMSYQLENLLVLPIVFAPFERNTIDERVKTFIPARNLILSYRQRDYGSDAHQTFVYRCVYILLSYLFLKLLLDESIPQKQRRRTFLPIVCMHTKPEPVDASRLDLESFLHNFTKVLSHMLAEDYQASSQGLHLQSASDRYKLPNALASLYNILPRRFSASALRGGRVPLDKLAIITVSSRKADLNQSSPDIYSSTIYGDVIGMEIQPDSAIHASMLTTFSALSEAEPMYERPEIIIEQVRTYFQQGYHHFLYVAQAPYTSTLHLPSADARTKLYFMNESVIQAMRQVDESIKIYPIFCDKYHVVRQRTASNKNIAEQTEPSREAAPAQEADSLYIDDLLELSGLASDKQKRTMTFFNVFNGLTVGRKDDQERRLYNGVISYGTLVNMYEDTLYYQYIWQDLLGERTPGSLATGLLDLLTLLHFLRYEKSKPDRFKLDPYSRIIGTESVGKRAIFPHATGSTRFNSLAFLTLVRSVLHTQHP